MDQLLKHLVNLLFIPGFLFLPVFTNAQTCNISGDLLVCEGKSITYNAPAGTDYQWEAFGGNILGSDVSQTVLVMWPSPGNYSLTLVVKDQAGNIICTLNQPIQVFPTPEPVITPSFISACKRKRAQGKETEEECFVVCDSTYVVYETPDNAGSSYSWNVTGSNTYTINNNQIEVYWTGTGQETVSVIETDSNGCIGETSICVEIIPNPIAAFTTSQPLTGGVYEACLGQEIIFFNNSSAGAGSPLNTLEWVFGDGSSQTVSLPSQDANYLTHSYTSPGTYQVMLIVENECYCQDTAFATIEVSALPGPDIFCISTVCPGTPQTYQTSADCPDYIWTADNGTIISGNGSNTVTVQWNSTGPNILTLDVDGCNDSMCSSPTSIVVPVIPSPVTIEGPDKICLNDCPTFRIDCSIPVNSIEWHFPPGVQVIGDSVNTHSVQVCFFQAISGTITVDYQYNLPGSIPELNCGGSSNLQIEVLPEMFIIGQSTFCLNDNFDFYIYNGDPGLVSWSIINPSGNTVAFSVTSGPPHHFSGTWTWGPGNFTIIAEDSTGNYCNGPKIKNIQVLPPPPPPDSILGDISVCPGQTYTYTAIPSSPDYYIEWQILNGSPATAIGNSINITWGLTGPYQVIAYQTNSTGCSSTGTSLNVNSILPLTATTINGPDTLCPNSEYNFSSPDPGDQFVWDINPPLAGSVISGQNSGQITLQTNNYQGTAWLVIERTMCGQSGKDSILLFIGSPPPPGINLFSPACQGEPVTMTASAPGASSFTWDFGDGNTGTGSSVSHSYFSPGNFTVVLTAHYSNNCNDSSSAVASIAINPKPNTTISTPDPVQYCQLPISTSMFVASPVTGNTYQWYDGNGFLTSGTNYTTTIPGIFVVITENSYGCKDTSNVIIVDTVTCDTCNPESHVVDFTRIRQGCNTDSFSATLTNATSPSWYFDDPHGSPATAQGNTATHTFPEPGFYKVRLCARVPEQNSTDTCVVCVEKIDTINYIADFYDSLYCVSNSDSFEVKFINNTKILSTAPIPSWSWSINANPPFSTAKNPVLTLAPGTYSVTLTVDGVCVITKTIVIPAVPSADFTAMDSVCVGSPISFTNTSTGSSLSSIWYFGDGAQSLITDPTRTYDAPGTYIASLVIANQYGCSDSVSQPVVVMPNTLTDSLIAGGSLTFCQGDSVQLSSTVSGGYPGYNYLWSNIENTPSIYAGQTGTYYVEVTDQLNCLHRSNSLNVIANPAPVPIITGPDIICYASSNDPFTVNYPYNAGFSFQWYLDGNPSGSLNSFYPGFMTLGAHQVVVVVTDPNHCKGVDTFDFVVVGNPNLTLSSTGSLCEGDTNLLVASSTTPGIEDFYWNTGVNNDTLITSVPDIYSVTVIDSNGCKATAAGIINPLPDLCGLITGCYDICDTVTELVWYAPPGYQSYTWYYNGAVIPGQTTSKLTVPLYQSGTYTVYVENSAGCGILSDPIEINFIGCGCEAKVKGKISCGPVDVSGQQTYYLELNIMNPLGNGASLVIYSSQGVLTNISTNSLVAGNNVVTSTFVPVSPTDTACFTVVITNEDKRCETEICLPLPPCNSDCQPDVEITSFNCSGFDDNGNPLYYFCMNVDWAGSNGATMTLVNSSGSFSPNPVTVNSGLQNLCFTFTDLPPTSNNATFEVYIYDPVKGHVCSTSVTVDYQPCEDCTFDIYGLCAHCERDSTGEIVYVIEATVDNPFNSSNISIVPVTPGVYGSPSPNPIGPGLQDISFTYAGTPPADSIICFKLLLTDNQGEQTCVKELCVILSACDPSGLPTIGKEEPKYIIAPNPAKDYIRILTRNVSQEEGLFVRVYDEFGKHLGDHRLNGQGANRITTGQWPGGMYILHIFNGDEGFVVRRVVVLKD